MFINKPGPGGREELSCVVLSPPGGCLALVFAVAVMIERKGVGPVSGESGHHFWLVTLLPGQHGPLQDGLGSGGVCLSAGTDDSV